MELRPDQFAAALACGCGFLLATEDQVRRLTVQRRIFLVHGEPVVAVRGGFFETWATLAALVQNHAPIAPEPSAEAGAVAAPEHATQSDAGPLLDAAQPAVAKAKRTHRGAAATTQRVPRAPRSMPPAPVRHIVARLWLGHPTPGRCWPRARRRRAVDRRRACSVAGGVQAGRQRRAG